MSNIPREKFIDGVKHIWDGRVYESGQAAGAAMSEYEQDNYESRMVSFGDRLLVYLRRRVETVPRA